MIRKLLSASAGLLFIAVATIGLLEIMVRMLAPQPEPNLWLKPDARYGHLIKPQFHLQVSFPGTDFVMDVQTNALGFRDDEVPPAQPGTKTIVFAGDSFTFGHGVAAEDRFDHVAEALLTAAGRPIRGINTGVSAWGTIQECRFLQDHLDSLQPDAVVLTFCENDPQDDDYFLATGISFDRVTFPGKEFLRAHSHLFRWLQQLYLVLRKRATVTASPEPTGDAPAGLAAMAHAAPPISDTQWQRTEKTLADFVSAWRQKNPQARLLVQCTTPCDPAITAKLKEIATRIEGAAYIDIAPAAESLPPAQRRLPFDGHWSPAMHRISGTAVADAIAALP